MFRLFRKKEKPTDLSLIDKGMRAETLLKSPVFAEAMAEVEEKIWEQFFGVEADDPGARDVLYTHITALTHIKETLEGFVEQGKLIKKITEDRNK